MEKQPKCRWKHRFIGREETSGGAQCENQMQREPTEMHTLFLFVKEKKGTVGIFLFQWCNTEQICYVKSGNWG